VELAAAGLSHAGSGNLSIWTPDAVIITREGAILNRLTAADLTEITRTTRPPGADPALDTPIHRAIYVTSGAKAIIHAHPPHAVALSMDRREFVPLDLEAMHQIGRVPVITQRRSIVDAIAASLEEHVITLVAGHGSYARGADLWECLRLTAALEASARLAWLRAALPGMAPMGGAE
jgi:L-fuculose-phosphate aldolase